MKLIFCDFIYWRQEEERRVSRFRYKLYPTLRMDVRVSVLSMTKICAVTSHPFSMWDEVLLYVVPKLASNMTSQCTVQLSCNNVRIKAKRVQ